MSYRKIKAIESKGFKLVLSYCNEWQEYRIRYYQQGEALADSDYFTDCRMDADSTLQSMFNRLEANNG